MLNGPRSKLLLSMKNAPSPFAERLQEAMDMVRCSRTELARALSVSPAAVGLVLSGSSKSLSAENCARAARRLGVSYFWLATGEGPVFEATHDIHSAREAIAGYYTPLRIIELMGELLASVPKALRGPVADLLAGWARSGGSPEYRNPLHKALNTQLREIKREQA